MPRSIENPYARAIAKQVDKVLKDKQRSPFGLFEELELSDLGASITKALQGTAYGINNILFYYPEDPEIDDEFIIATIFFYRLEHNPNGIPLLEPFVAGYADVLKDGEP